MDLVVGLLLFFGYGWVLITALVPLYSWHCRRLLRRLRGASRPPCVALTVGGTLPPSVLMRGRTAPGPEGMLRSPAFGTPCVWFETIVTDDVGDSPSTWFHRSAGGPFGLTDGTGTVLLVDASCTDQARATDRRTESATVSRTRGPEPWTGTARLEQVGALAERRRGHRKPVRLTLTENVVLAGQELTVLARPRRAADGTVVLDRPGETSHREPDAWIEQVEEDIAYAPRLVGGLLVLGGVAIAMGHLLDWLGGLVGL